jgi:hypothetical protein
MHGLLRNFHDMFWIIVTGRDFLAEATMTEVIEVREIDRGVIGDLIFSYIFMMTPRN